MSLGPDRVFEGELGAEQEQGQNCHKNNGNHPFCLHTLLDTEALNFVYAFFIKAALQVSRFTFHHYRNGTSTVPSRNSRKAEPIRRGAKTPRLTDALFFLPDRASIRVRKLGEACPSTEVTR